MSGPDRRIWRDDHGEDSAAPNHPPPRTEGRLQERLRNRRGRPPPTGRPRGPFTSQGAAGKPGRRAPPSGPRRRCFRLFRACPAPPAVPGGLPLVVWSRTTFPRRPCTLRRSLERCQPDVEDWSQPPAFCLSGAAAERAGAANLTAPVPESPAAQPRDSLFPARTARSERGDQAFPPEAGSGRDVTVAEAPRLPEGTASPPSSQLKGARQ